MWVSHLAVFVEMDKGSAYVKMWKSGLEASLEEINGTEDAKKSSKALKPSDERDPSSRRQAWDGSN